MVDLPENRDPPGGAAAGKNAGKRQADGSDEERDAKRVRRDPAAQDVGPGQDVIRQSTETGADAPAAARGQQGEGFVFDSAVGTPISWSPSPDREMLDAPLPDEETTAIPEAGPVELQAELPEELGAPLGADDAPPARRSRNAPPKPLRTLHTFFEGDRDDELLIADAEELMSGSPEVTFRTRAGFERKFGHSPTKRELDRTCVLIKQNGNYHTRADIFWRFDVDTSLTWEAELQERQLQFNEIADRLGLSNDAFQKRQASPTRQSPIRGVYQPQRHTYDKPLQAGKTAPVVLLRTDDREVFNAIVPAHRDETRAMQSSQELLDYFGQDNVWLKNADHSFLTRDAFNAEEKSPNAAEIAFAAYVGRPYEAIDDPMPYLFIRTHGERFVSQEKFAIETAGQPWALRVGTATDMLFLTSAGQTLAQAGTIVFMRGGETQELDERLKPVGLTSTQYAAHRNAPVAPVLFRTGPEELVLVGPGAAIPPRVDPWRIFIQNLSSNGNYTGNFKALPAFLRSGKSLTPEQQEIVYPQRVHARPIAAATPSSAWTGGIGPGFGARAAQAAASGSLPMLPLGFARSRRQLTGSTAQPAGASYLNAYSQDRSATGFTPPAAGRTGFGFGQQPYGANSGAQNRQTGFARSSTPQQHSFGASTTAGSWLAGGPSGRGFTPQPRPLSGPGAMALLGPSISPVTPGFGGGTPPTGFGAPPLGFARSRRALAASQAPTQFSPASDVGSLYSATPAANRQPGFGRTEAAPAPAPRQSPARPAPDAPTQGDRFGVLMARHLRGRGASGRAAAPEAAERPLTAIELEVQGRERHRDLAKAVSWLEARRPRERPRSMDSR